MKVKSSGIVSLSRKFAFQWFVALTYAMLATSVNAAPDLIITALSVTPNSGVPGSQFTVNLTLKNQGTTSAAASTFRSRISSNCSTVSTADPLLFDSTPAALVAGASATYFYAASVPLGLAAGPYCVWGIADVTNSIGQSNVNNDKATASYTVTAPGAPDLIITNLSVSPTSGLPGSQFTLNMTLKNQGTALAPASTFRARISASCSTVTTTDPLLFDSSPSALPAGTSATYSYATAVPLGLAAGQYCVWGIADVNNAIGQSNTNNDKATAVLTVTAPITTYDLSLYRTVDGIKSDNGAILTATADLLNYSQFTTNPVSGGPRSGYSVYNAGTPVTVTAPSTVGGKSFQGWSDCTGTVKTTSLSYSFTMGSTTRGLCADYVSPAASILASVRAPDCTIYTGDSGAQRVYLFNASYGLIAGPTPSPASFTGLTSGSLYQLEARHVNPVLNVEELWGYASMNVAAGSNSVQLCRSYPYAPSVGLSNATLGSSQNLGVTVAPGSNISAVVPVLNKRSIAHSVRVISTFSDGVNTFAPVTSVAQTIAANGTASFSIPVVTSAVAGRTYSVVLRIETFTDSWKVTDTWGQTVLFSVSTPQPVQVTLQNVNGGAFPPGNAFFSVVGTTKSYVGSGASVSIADLSPGNYTIEGYSPPTTGGVGEYWGRAIFSVPSAAPVSVARTEPYLQQASASGSVATQGNGTVTFYFTLAQAGSVTRSARVRVYLENLATPPSSGGWPTSTASVLLTPMVTVPIGGTATTSVAWSPSSATPVGDWYWTYQIETNVGSANDPVKTDTAPWSSPRKVSVTSGNTTINYSIVGGNAASSAKLYLTCGGSAIAANASGPVGTFGARANGTHCVEAYSRNGAFSPTAVDEYWGRASVVASGGAVTATITRTEPTMGALQFLDASGQSIGNGSSPVGAPITVSMPVSIPPNTTQRGVQAVFDFRTSTSPSIQKSCTTQIGNVTPGGGAVNLVCTFTPDIVGTWQRQVKLLSNVAGGNPSVVTDSRPFSATEVVTVAPAVSTTLTLAVTAVSVGSTNLPNLAVDPIPVVRGQKIAIRVRVTDSAGQPVSNATVAADTLALNWLASTPQITTTPLSNGEYIVAFFIPVSNTYAPLDSQKPLPPIIAYTKNASGATLASGALSARTLIISPPTYGVTFVTSGFQFWRTCDPLTDIAKAVLKRAGRGRLWQYDYNSETFTQIDMSSVVAPADLYDGEQVVIVNWCDVSNNATPGYAEATAHQLYVAAKAFDVSTGSYGNAATGLFKSRPDGKLRAVHVIAHSFGTSLGFELSRRLRLLEGIDNLQLTTLDPHDWAQVLTPVDGQTKLPNVDLTRLGTAPGLSADNYYQRVDLTYVTPVGVQIPAGRCVSSAYNQKLDLIFAPPLGIAPPNYLVQAVFGDYLYHSMVHRYYLATILPDEANSAGFDPAWLTDAERYETGYHSSRVAGWPNSIQAIACTDGTAIGTDPSDVEVMDGTRYPLSAYGVFDGGFHPDLDYASNEPRPGYRIGAARNSLIAFNGQRGMRISGRAGSNALWNFNDPWSTISQSIETRMTYIGSNQSIRFKLHTELFDDTIGSLRVYAWRPKNLDAYELGTVDALAVPTGQWGDICLNIPPALTAQNTSAVIGFSANGTTSFALDDIALSSTPCSTYSLTVNSTLDGVRSGGVTVPLSPSAVGSVQTITTTSAGPSAFVLYAPTTFVTLTAQPSHPVSGAPFVAWIGCDSATNYTCNLTLTGHRAVSATFASTPATYTLTTAGVNGTVVASPALTTYANGQVVSLLATPNNGFYFAGWSGGGCSGTGSCRLVMSNNQFVTAFFSPCTLSINPTSSPLLGAGAAAGLSFAVSTQSGSCHWSAAAASGAFAAVATTNGAASGTVNYSVSSNTGSARSTPITVTLGATTATHTVNQGAAATSTFQLVTAASPINGGSVTPASGNYASGAVVAVTQTAAPGFYFSSWAGACSGAGTCSVTMSAAQSVIANFTRCTYAVNPTSAALPAAGGGSSFSVATQAGCSVVANSDQSWLFVTVVGSNVNVSAAGNGSGATRTAIVTVGSSSFLVTQTSDIVDNSPPTAPTNLAANALTAADATLSWNAATDAGGSGLAGYRLERCSGAWCTNFVQIWSGIGTSYVDTGLTASTTYLYRVRSYDGAGNLSGYSATVTVTTLGVSPVCTFSLNVVAYSYSSLAAAADPLVQTQAGCAWTAESEVNWMQITANASGTGGNIRPYVVISANQGTSPRVGRILLKNSAGVIVATFTATQDGAATTQPKNVAASLNGGVASASSTVLADTNPTMFPSSSAIDGDRGTTNWGSGGGWADGYPRSPGVSTASPSWLQSTFTGTKTIDRIDVITVADNYASAGPPTSAALFSLYGLTDYKVQYWSGSTWQDVASVAGNRCVWKTLTFAPVTTTAVRVLATGAPDGAARIAEFEAWEVGATTVANPVSTCAATAWTVTATTMATGSVTPATQTVASGNTASVTFTPPNGYSISTVNTTCGGTLVGNVFTTGPVTANCSLHALFAQISTPVNGVCGGASQGVFTLPPTTDLCATGVASALSGNGPWTWTCSGSNGGTNATCSTQVAASCVVNPIALNSTVTATLAPGCISSNRTGNNAGAYAKFYSFTLSVPTTVTISLAGAMDTYLYLLQGASVGGAVIASDDDGLGSLNSRIVATNLAPGTYTIEATTYLPSVAGDISVSLAGAAPPTTTCSATGRMLGKWRAYGTATYAGGNYVVGDSIGYGDQNDVDGDCNPVVTWWTGSPSGGSGEDVDVLTYTPPIFGAGIDMSWTGCIGVTQASYHNVGIIGRNAAFTGLPNSQQNPWSGYFEVAFTTKLGEAALRVGGSDGAGGYVENLLLQATVSNGSFCGDFRIVSTATTRAAYFNGNLVFQGAPIYPSNRIVVATSSESPVTLNSVQFASTTKACTLDLTADGAASATDDGLLINRYLMGFRGDSLTSGVILPSWRPNSIAIEEAMGDGACFDVLDRWSSAPPSATVDGLILSRLLRGLPNSSLLNGINLPLDAGYTTAAEIRAYVNWKFGTAF